MSTNAILLVWFIESRRPTVDASLFSSRNLRGGPQLSVEESPGGLRFALSSAHDYGSLSEEISPEEVAHLAHALNLWIARFTSNA